MFDFNFNDVQKKEENSTFHSSQLKVEPSKNNNNSKISTVLFDAIIQEEKFPNSPSGARNSGNGWRNSPPQIVTPPTNRFPFYITGLFVNIDCSWPNESHDFYPQELILKYVG